MRIVKEHDERRNEILDAATKLFQTKGYVKCTINDIIDSVKIAKGTFYYYFKSKEEVLNAVVLRFCDVIENRAKQIAAAEGMQPQEKLIQVFMSMSIKEEVGAELIEQVHQVDNALLQQKIMSRTITVITPILASVIEEGNQKKVWNCSNPIPYLQIILTSSITLLDGGIFVLSQAEQYQVVLAVISIFEQILHLPEHSMQKSVMQFMESDQPQQ